MEQEGVVDEQMFPMLSPLQQPASSAFSHSPLAQQIAVEQRQQQQITVQGTPLPVAKQKPGCPVPTQQPLNRPVEQQQKSTTEQMHVG